MQLWELDESIKAVAPILGVRSDKTIVFKPEATLAERAAAQAIANAADLSTPTDIDKLASGRFDNMDKTVKAVLLLMRTYCNAVAAGTYTAKTIPQVKADFITAFKALP